MPKQSFADYEDELAAQRSAWERKPALRSVYRSWYRRLVDQLGPVGPTVEIGGGSGNFSEFLPEAVSTDVIPSLGQWRTTIVRTALAELAHTRLRPVAASSGLDAAAADRGPVVCQRSPALAEARTPHLRER